MNDSQKAIIRDASISLGVMSRDRDISDLFIDTITNFEDHSIDDFIFILEKCDFMRESSLVMESLKKMESDNDKYRSELWRSAVISATDVKHNNPIEYADKILERYDERFNIK